jgi:hypothetical protein
MSACGENRLIIIDSKPAGHESDKGVSPGDQHGSSLEVNIHFPLSFFETVRENVKNFWMSLNKDRFGQSKKILLFLRTICSVSCCG